jgi:hypothetical protein
MSAQSRELATLEHASGRAIARTASDWFGFRLNSTQFGSFAMPTGRAPTPDAL